MTQGAVRAVNALEALPPVASEAGLVSDRAGARALAIFRPLLLPIVFAGDRLVEHDTVGTGRFDLVLAVAGLYSLLALMDAWRGRESLIPVSALLTCDLVLVAALTYESGGAFSQLRAAFLALPLGAALLGSTRRTAGVSAVTGIIYMLVAVAHPVTPGTRRLAVALAQGLYVVWFGGASVLLAALLNARRGRIADLARARGRLVAQAVTAEERARRDLSAHLHDEIIQTVLSARQDLAEVRGGRPEMLELAEQALRQVVGQLRAIIAEIHPTYLLDHLDLRDALEMMVARQTARSDFETHLHIDPEASGLDGQLILSLARELFLNAARHAQASNVFVTVDRDANSLVLEVSDDGCGFTEQELRLALQAGHIGLASARERVELAGGEFEISSGAGNGTSVRCRIPAAPRDAAGAKGTPVAVRNRIDAI